MCHIQITDIVTKQIHIHLNPKPQRYIILSQLEREREREPSLLEDDLLKAITCGAGTWVCMLHANLPISQQHIQTPFFIKTHKILEKAPKQYKLKVGYLWLATLGKSFPILASMWHTIHHASSEQSKDNVTCFCFHGTLSFFPPQDKFLSVFGFRFRVSVQGLGHHIRVIILKLVCMSPALFFSFFFCWVPFFFLLLSLLLLFNS